MNKPNRPDYAAAAEGQAFFAKMAEIYGNKDASKAHWDLALNYQRDHITGKAA